jgi:hypothetical protein
MRQHTSAYVSIRQHTSAYVSIRQHTSAYVSISQHTKEPRASRCARPAYVSIYQHTCAFMRIRQHTCACVSTCGRPFCRRPFCLTCRTRPTARRQRPASAPSPAPLWPQRCAAQEHKT